MLTADDTQLCCPTALVYETTEEARLLLQTDSELADARHAAGEAAYYLSDTIEPDERESLLEKAETWPRLTHKRDEDTEDRAAEALTLMSDAAGEVEEMLRGPSANSELRIALRALRRGIGDLARFLGLETNHLDVSRLRGERPGVLRRLRAGPCR
jgi:hypothetical protein